MVLAYFFLLIPVVLAGLIVGAWFVLLLVLTRAADSIRSVPHREFFGFGGPDDPFTVRVARESVTGGSSSARTDGNALVDGPAPSRDGHGATSDVPDPADLTSERNREVRHDPLSSAH
jgi:hypothetical protein